MKTGLVLTIAVALLVAGAVTSWWQRSDDTRDGERTTAVGLLAATHCGNEDDERKCVLTDDPTTFGRALHWAFAFGLVASALLIAAHTAPPGTRARGGLATAGLVATALALMSGLGVLSLLIYVGVETKSGHPGIGGILFIAGGIAGLAAARRILAEPRA